MGRQSMAEYGSQMQQKRFIAIRERHCAGNDEDPKQPLIGRAERQDENMLRYQICDGVARLFVRYENISVIR